MAIEPYKLRLNTENRSLQFPRENKAFSFEENSPIDKPCTSIELASEQPNHRHLIAQDDEMIFSSNMTVYNPSITSKMPVAKPNPSVNYHMNNKK